MEGLIGTSLYGPNNVAKPITRGEMARIIIRAYNKFEDNPLTLEECEPLKSKIKDYDSIPSLYKPFVLLAYGSGIISGYSDGRALDPMITPQEPRQQPILSVILTPVREQKL